MEYGVKITVDTIDRPKEWVSVSVGPQYGYSASVRGLFTRDDLDGQLTFVHAAVETVWNLERMNAEADEREAQAGREGQ